MELGLVTSNVGKLRELAAALEPTGHTVAQRALEYPEVQAASLEAVAEFGLEWLAQRHAGEALLIDDAGLFVDALGGFPGVYSRYAHDTIGPAGVLALLGDEGARSAEFRCVLGLLLPDGGRQQFRDLLVRLIKREGKRDIAGVLFDLLVAIKLKRHDWCEIIHREQITVGDPRGLS